MNVNYSTVALASAQLTSRLRSSHTIAQNIDSLCRPTSIGQAIDISDYFRYTAHTTLPRLRGALAFTTPTQSCHVPTLLGSRKPSAHDVLTAAGSGIPRASLPPRPLDTATSPALPRSLPARACGRCKQFVFFFYYSEYSRNLKSLFIIAIPKCTLKVR